LFQAQEEDSPLRDFVLLSFLAGHSRKRLGVNPPDLLRRILFNEGLAALGLRATTVSIAALALSGTLLFALWPKPPQPKPDDLAKNSPTPTPNETVTPTPATSPNVTPTPTGTRTPTGYSVNLGEGVRPLELVALTGGVFTMGSDKVSDDEKPPHQVRLSAFSIGKYEVTQAQWQAVMGNNPSYFKGDGNLPVESVSWNDVQEFIKRLNDKTGSQQFRLPTEAEWEYAARAGTNTEYSFGDDEKLLGEYAWYIDNSGNKTQPVGTKKANPFGLFDMGGNVWEWCLDWYGENYYQQFGRGVVPDPRGPRAGSDRVMRGGGWGNDGAVDCRSADRGSGAPDDRNGFLGFRLVRIGR